MLNKLTAEALKQNLAEIDTSKIAWEIEEQGFYCCDMAQTLDDALAASKEPGSFVAKDIEHRVKMIVEMAYELHRRLQAAHSEAA